MSKLMEGKTAIVIGVWNKWSIAYAIAEAFAREGAKLLLTYQNDRAKPQVEELGRDSAPPHYSHAKYSEQADIDKLAESLNSRRPQTGCAGAQHRHRASGRSRKTLRTNFPRGI